MRMQSGGTRISTYGGHLLIITWKYFPLIKQNQIFSPRLISFRDGLDYQIDNYYFQHAINTTMEGIERHINENPQVPNK